MVSLLLVSKPKYSMKLTVLISIIFTLVLLAVNIVIFLPLGPVTYQNHFILTVFTPEAILAALLGKRKNFSAVTAIINAYISFYILMLTISAFSNWITETKIQLFLIVLGSIFIFIYLKLFYTKIHNQIETTLPKFFKYLLIYGILMFLEINIYQFLIGAFDTKHVLRLEIFGVAILSVYILSIVFMHYLIKQYYAKIVQLKDNEWLENHLQYTIEQIKQQERKESELRILHHDIRHILTTTSTLIQNNENDKALEFLNQYISLNNKTRRRRYCEDSFINSALDYYYNICKDNDIKFNCKLNNIEEALKIPSHEVAVVISNCLENAINASLKLESNRLINLTFLNNNGRLVLRVENNYNGIIEVDNNNHPISTEENHGIGTASIQYFAKRNDLIIDYEMTNSLFKIIILFK
jgi:hypothetical protein